MTDDPTDDAATSARDRTRAHLIEVAGALLAEGGPAAVTTRSVALAAGTQAPTIYRLFGDKIGLLEAVVADGMARYVREKHVADDADPVDDLRDGWDAHVGFGLAHPELFRLLHVGLRSDEGLAAIEAGAGVLRERVHRVAAAGRLRVPEARAVDLIRAAGTGVVFTLLEAPDDASADDGLAEAAWRAVSAAILDSTPAAVDGPAAAAVALRAALPEQTRLSASERALLGEWLERIAD